jgi:predicted lipid-binding transport protein (Tim44 family)
VALPQPVAPVASAPVAASTPARVSESRSMSGMSGGLIAALLVAIGAGVIFARRRR